ncbi:MAG: Maf family protein [Armatimonadetes bacterium]|nr:Maf family protein [Armatimonadota bacterium]
MLREIFPEFEVAPAEIDETAPPGLPPEEVALELSRTKAFAPFGSRPQALVLAGDTIVVLTSGSTKEILGKPESPEEAVAMLQKLSGRSHEVFTAMYLLWPDGEYGFVERSLVRFRELTLKEIEAYVASGEPMDKAGSYGIQGAAGGFIAEVEGSIKNVAGLPVERLREELARIFAPEPTSA